MISEAYKWAQFFFWWYIAFSSVLTLIFTLLYDKKLVSDLWHGKAKITCDNINYSRAFGGLGGPQAPAYNVTFICMYTHDHRRIDITWGR